MQACRQETVKAGINPLSWADSVSGRRNPSACKRWRRDVLADIHRADGGDLRPARPDSEVGRGTVSQNIVGLVLVILLALFLFAALLFPERF
jgi:K+-transporting ATPase KdpF subunit